MLFERLVYLVVCLGFIGGGLAILREEWGRREVGSKLNLLFLLVGLGAIVLGSGALIAMK